VPASKFTHENRRVILTAISLCAPRKTAAAKAKIDEKTLRNWLDRGERHELFEPGCGEEPDPDGEQYAEFRRDFLHNEAQAEHTLVGSLIAAANNKWKPDWKAAAWLLERRWSDRWGYKQQLQHTGKDGDSLPTPTGVMLLPALEDDGGAGD